LNVHCREQPEDPAELRIVVTIKCSVEAFAARSRELRQSEDILRPDYELKSLQDDLKIVGLKCLIQKIRNVGGIA
jgi:hypothetical protein